MRSKAELNSEVEERTVQRATRRQDAARRFRSRKVCISILGRGSRARALVPEVVQPARAINKPMLRDANTAHRQKVNKIRYLGGGGGIEPAPQGNDGTKKA
jgi:hypothetical protein